MYTPVGLLESTLAAYQTSVVSFVAVVAVSFSVHGEPLAGMPAHLLVADVELDSAEYVVSNGEPGVANPQVLVASVAGVPTVFDEAAIEFAPLTSVVVASTSWTVNV